MHAPTVKGSLEGSLLPESTQTLLDWPMEIMLGDNESASWSKVAPSKL